MNCLICIEQNEHFLECSCKNKICNNCIKKINKIVSYENDNIVISIKCPFCISSIYLNLVKFPNIYQLEFTKIFLKNKQLLDNINHINIELKKQENFIEDHYYNNQLIEG